MNKTQTIKKSFRKQIKHSFKLNKKEKVNLIKLNRIKKKHILLKKLRQFEIKSISKLGIKRNDPLCQKVELALSNFNQLDLNKSYHLAFSGGKDSHALLIIYLLWKLIYKKEINLTIMFSDTRLESDSLYQIIENIETFLKDKEKFERVYPENNYWYYQFVIGYPVPDWRIRWCTQKLKITPMSKEKTLAITGRHFGESEARDLRLKTDNCSSGECGIDKVKKSFDPIIHFRNCDIWDLIFYADGTILYENVFSQLKATYSQSTNEKGSLRMGCFMCPVISINTLAKDKGREESIPIRKTLDRLRNCRRINNPNPKKGKYVRGAIHIEDRRKIWQELDKSILLEKGFITELEIKEIDYLIQTNSYPKTYSQEWIESEHKRLNKEPLQLSLF